MKLTKVGTRVPIDIDITTERMRIDDFKFDGSQSPEVFEKRLGPPIRIVKTHDCDLYAYEGLSLCVVDGQVTNIGLLMSADADRYPWTKGIYPGRLLVGGTSVTADTREADLTQTSMPFRKHAANEWIYWIGGYFVRVYVDGRKLPSGRRGRTRFVTSVSATPGRRTPWDYLAVDGTGAVPCGDIWNCDNAFDFRCPRSWESLNPTNEADVRYCEQCQQNVTLCSSPDEFVRLGNAGQCVAVPNAKSFDKLQPHFLGRPSRETLVEFEGESRQWWTTVLERAPQFAPEAMLKVAVQIQKRTYELRDPSHAYHKFITEIRKAASDGPKTLYRILLTLLSDKEGKLKNVYKVMRCYFPLNYEEFELIVTEVEENT